MSDIWGGMKWCMKISNDHKQAVFTHLCSSLAWEGARRVGLTLPCSLCLQPAEKPEEKAARDFTTIQVLALKQKN